MAQIPKKKGFSNHKYDPRLARRLKGISKANQCLKQNSWGNGSTRIRSRDTLVRKIVVNEDYQKYLSRINRSDYVCGSSVKKSEHIVQNEVNLEILNEGILSHDTQVEKVDPDYANFLKVYSQEHCDDDVVGVNNNVPVNPSADGNASQRTESNNNIQVEQMIEDQDYQKYIDSLVGYIDNGDDGGTIKSVGVGETNETMIETNVDVKSIDNTFDDGGSIKSVGVGETNETMIETNVDAKSIDNTFDDGGSIETVNVAEANMTMNETNVDAKSIDNTFDDGGSIETVNVAKANMTMNETNVDANSIDNTFEDGGSIESVDVGEANETMNETNVDAKSIDNTFDDDVDPHFKMFLENLRLDGNSYALEVTLQNGISELIRYKDDDVLPDTPNILESCCMNRKTKDKKFLRRTSIGIKAEELNSSDSFSSSEGNHSPRSLRRLMRHKRKLTAEISTPVKRIKGSVVERAGNVEFSNPASAGQKSVRSKVRPHSEVIELEKFETNHEAEDDEIDKSYREFLNSLEREGQILASVPKCEKHEEDQESHSDGDMIVWDTYPTSNGDHAPTVPSGSVPDELMDSDSDSIVECPDTCSSQYKEALMETIKKSYDTDEFLDLQKEVCFTNRRIEKELNLRGVTKTCPSDRLAKSYLELYPALHREVNLAGSNYPKALSLFRGFFYWLQNTVHESVPLRYVFKLVGEAKVSSKISK